jgi:uncharacterized membrane protein YGL010W
MWRSFVNDSGVIFSPVAEILLIHSLTDVKMRFVATEESCVGSNMRKRSLTQILAVGVVCWAQLLGHRYFEGMKIQIEMQDPPQTAV